MGWLGTAKGELLRPILTKSQASTFVYEYCTTKAGGLQGCFSPFSSILRFGQRRRPSSSKWRSKSHQDSPAAFGLTAHCPHRWTLGFFGMQTFCLGNCIEILIGAYKDKRR
jgi:hypothetical protein